MDNYYAKFVNHCSKVGIHPQTAAKHEGIPWSTVLKWKKRSPSPGHAEAVDAFLLKSADMFLNRNAVTMEAITEGVAMVKQKQGEANEIVKTEGEILTIKEMQDLLLPHEVVRDPIHGDIWITALERTIIDSPAFQRLRKLSQLGPTKLVYHGATHDRFGHSLGTLQSAEDLVNIINKNAKVYDKPHIMSVDDYPHLLIRLCALLHDVAHMPFGHTLSKEGNLAPDEWSDETRAKLWLKDDNKRSITSRMRDFLIEKGIAEERAKRVVDDVIKYLVNLEQPMKHAHPYICDIVGNTLCADLLDYVERDMYFCGLKEKSGDRVIKYLSVMRLVPTDKGSRQVQGEAANKGEAEDNEEFEPSNDEKKGKGRVVLLGYRFEREHSPEGKSKLVRKIEILSEAIDLLRRRFALAEKVYFHRTKTEASAMLISAVASSTVPLEMLYPMGEEQTLLELCRDTSEKNARCRHLLSAYEERRLFKPVYQIDYIKEEETEESLSLWKGIYPKYRRPTVRRELEEDIEYVADLPPGSIAVYCPHKGMNVKSFEMLVHSQPEGNIKRLGRILDDNRLKEMEAINERFERLWKLQVFVDPEVIDPSQVSNGEVQDLNALCEKFMKFPNSIQQLQGKGKALEYQIAGRVAHEYEEKNPGIEVPYSVVEQVVVSSAKGRPREMISAYRVTLNTLMGGRREAP